MGFLTNLIGNGGKSGGGGPSPAAPQASGSTPAPPPRAVGPVGESDAGAWDRIRGMTGGKGGNGRAMDTMFGNGGPPATGPAITPAANPAVDMAQQLGIGQAGSMGPTDITAATMLQHIFGR